MLNLIPRSVDGLACRPYCKSSYVRARPAMFADKLLSNNFGLKPHAIEIRPCSLLVIGLLIPAGFAPTSISLNADGSEHSFDGLAILAPWLLLPRGLRQRPSVRLGRASRVRLRARQRAAAARSGSMRSRCFTVVRSVPFFWLTMVRTVARPREVSSAMPRSEPPALCSFSTSATWASLAASGRPTLRGRTSAFHSGTNRSIW